MPVLGFVGTRILACGDAEYHERPADLALSHHCQLECAEWE